MMKYKKRFKLTRPCEALPVKPKRESNLIINDEVWNLNDKF